MKTLLLLFLASFASAQDSPFTLRDGKSNQDYGGLNGNFAEQNNTHKNKLTTTLTPASCPAGQTLTGAYYKNGYTYGGVCGATSGGSSSTGSSSFSITNVSGSQTVVTLNVCISTVSITPIGSTITIKGNGSVSATGPTRTGVGVLMNGGYILGESASSFLMNFGQGVVGYNYPLSFDRTITGLTPGTAYNFCIGFPTDSGATVNIPGSLASQFQFGVYEIIGAVGATGATGPAGPAGSSGSTVSVNSSMIGDGSSGNPIGVLSSSVAILSSGFVLNQQIDSSSVTKQGWVTLANLGGAVPVGSVNLSTVTTSLSSKVDKNSTDQVNLSTVTTALALKVDRNSPDQVNLSTVTTALSGKVDKNSPDQVNLSTVTSRFQLVEASTGNLYSVKLSTGVPVPSNLIDLSTVTSALSGKQATGNYITALTGPVTASGPGSAASTIVGPIPNGTVDFSTITTALSGKQATGNYITSLTGQVTASGPGSVAATIVGPISSTAIDLSTVTTALALKAPLAGPTFTGTVLGVSGATETVNASMIGVGTVASPLGVNASSVAILGSNGLVLNQQIDSSSITKLGNIFNGASQLVLIDGTGKLPAIDGSALLNLPSTSGGAVLASTQTFSGSNTFGGSGITTTTVQGAFLATGPVRISTGSIVYFNASAFTTTNTSFLPSSAVTGSTISFTVQGTTVACWVVGNSGNASLSNNIMGIGVDGKINSIPGTSSTIGVIEGQTFSGGNQINPTSFPPIEFQVTKGAHAFFLGLWTTAGTAVFPYASHSIGQFGCREVMSQ